MTVDGVSLLHLCKYRESKLLKTRITTSIKGKLMKSNGEMNIYRYGLECLNKKYYRNSNQSNNLIKYVIKKLKTEYLIWTDILTFLVLNIERLFL